MKIAIMGTGGLGGYFGGRLAQAGRDVTFIARGAHLQAIREHGLQVKSPNGDFLVKPAQVTANPREVGPVDLILFCVKAYDAASAAEQMKPMVGAQTAVIPVLNGIDHIDTLKAIVGKEQVLGGVAVCGASVLSPGVIQHTGAQKLRFGELGGGDSPRCEAIQKTLAVNGISVACITDIWEKMWEKLMIISGVGICSLVRGGFAVVGGTPETLELVRQACQETVAIGQARDIALNDSAADEFANSMRGTTLNIKPSMLFDLEHGKRLEVEWLNGAISRMGKELGVPTPVNDFIYACLKPWANGT